MDKQLDKELPQIEDCPIASLNNFPYQMKCAWYDMRRGCCAIVSTARELRQRPEAVFKGS